MADTKPKPAAKKPPAKAKVTPVYATQTCRIHWSGGSAMFYEGTAYASDHPGVKHKPELFADKLEPYREVFGRSRSVERATAAPGEKRG